MSLPPGARLGPYELVELLGAGGMGEVYRAHDPRLGRYVAIKVLPEAVAADSDRLRRLQDEARAVAALNHPNICQIFDVGPDYLVLEFIDGRCYAVRFPFRVPVTSDCRLRVHSRPSTHRESSIEI